MWNPISIKMDSNRSAEGGELPAEKLAQPRMQVVALESKVHAGRAPPLALEPEDFTVRSRALEIAQTPGHLVIDALRYAVTAGRVDRDFTLDLDGALASVARRHRATLLDPKAIGGLLHAIDGYDGNLATRGALKLAPFVFVRPGDLRQADGPSSDGGSSAALQQEHGTAQVLEFFFARATPTSLRRTLHADPSLGRRRLTLDNSLGHYTNVLTSGPRWSWINGTW